MHETRITNLGAIIDGEAPGEWAAIIEVQAQSGSRTYTYFEVRATVAGVARGLLARGLGRGDRVAILAENCAAYLLAYMGVMQAGLTAVPVNFKLPQTTIDHIIEDSEIRFAFVDEEREPMLAGKLPLQSLSSDVPTDFGRFLDPGLFEPEAMEESEVATILYTSGSTGLPKGVPLTHGGYVWATGCYPELNGLVQGQPVLVAAPLFHMNALFFSKLLLRHGATNVLMRTFSASGYLRAIDRHRCTAITSVPTMLALAAREIETLAEVDLTSVATVLTGSAPSTEELFARVRGMFPNATIANSWGTTESGPVGFGPHPEGKPTPSPALGYPRPGVALRLVGGANEGEGVLHIRNGSIMTGYLNRPEATEKCLADNWYNTGDVMRRDDDGFYFFVGRADDMFTCGGENIYPGEVERMLEHHPGVAQAAVVPVPDDIKHQLPVAFVVPKPGQMPGEESVKAFALANGPAYAHPRSVWNLSELPLSGTNKVDRKTLTDLAKSRFVRRRTT